MLISTGLTLTVAGALWSCTLRARTSSYADIYFVVVQYLYPTIHAIFIPTRDVLPDKDTLSAWRGNVGVVNPATPPHETQAEGDTPRDRGSRSDGDARVAG